MVLEKEVLTNMFEKLEKDMHKNISIAVSEVAKEVNDSLKSILKSVFDQIQSLEGSMWKDILEAKVLLDKHPDKEEETWNKDLSSNFDQNSIHLEANDATKEEFMAFPGDFQSPFSPEDFSNEQFLNSQDQDSFLPPLVPPLESMDEKYSTSKPKDNVYRYRPTMERKGKYKKSYSCDVCDYETDFITELKGHIDDKHDGISSLIEMIEKQEIENEKLRAEQLRIANEKKNKKPVVPKEPMESYNIEFLCKICTHCSRDKNSYDEHQDMHAKVEKLTIRYEDPATNTKYLECKECGYKTTTSRMQRSNFTGHVKHVHLQIKKYTCDQCGYSAAYNNGLKQHIRHVHNKEYDYFCQLCSFGTTKKSLVGAHMRRKHRGYVDPTANGMDVDSLPLPKELTEASDEMEKEDC